MKLRQIRIAFSAIEFNFTQDLGFITVLAETAIVILDIPGGNNNTVSYFKKIGIIAAFRAHNPHTGIFIH